MTEVLVTIATCVAPHEARLVQASLAAYDIPVFIADEFTIGISPVHATVLGGVKVQVPSSFVEEARVVLGDVPLRSEKRPRDEEIGAETPPHPRKIWIKCVIWAWLALAAVVFGLEFIRYVGRLLP